MSGQGTPKVTVAVAGGNLQRQVNVIDGVAGLVGTSLTMIGQINTVYSYDDAVSKGYTVADEPYLNDAIQQFYAELGGSQKLMILGVEDTMTLTQMVTSTNTNGLKKLLNAARGEITIVGLIRKPDNSYVPVAGHYLDKDVEDALVASKTLAQYQQFINKPVRLLIQGLTNDLTQTPFDVTSATNGFAGVVLGYDHGKDSGLVPVALARAVKYGSHVKLGNGLNGALSVLEAWIGNKSVDDYFPDELDQLSGNGYIIPMRRDGSAGYYFGRDNMASDDDFSILAHGRVIDKAQRIAVLTLTPELETSFRLEDDGTINASDALHSEESIKKDIKTKMAGQMSGVDVHIPTNENIINSETEGVKISILPLAYKTWITVTIGLTSNL